MRAHGASALIASMLIAGCASTGGTGRAPLQPVSLPDVSQLVNAPVREQLQRSFAALNQEIENRSTNPLGLGADFGEMGVLFLAAEYFKAAEPCFLNAQSLLPNDVRWPYYLGRTYRSIGDLEKSAAAFERARALRPDDEATLVWLGNIRLDQGRPEAAAPLFERALTANPRSAASLYGLGRTALAGRQFQRAADYLEQAKRLDGRASVLHYPLAMAYRGLGQPDKAEIEVLQRGEVEVGLADPMMEHVLESLETSAGYESRAMRASRAGEWKVAAGFLRRSIELAPENADLRAKLGVALSSSSAAEDRAEAETAFRTAVKMAPALAPAHFQLGLLLLSGGRVQEAIDELAATVRLAPDDLHARFQLAEALRQDRRAQEALSHYDGVLRSDPQMVEARFGYAMTLVLLKRYAEARARLAEDAKHYPASPEFAEALARLQGGTTRSESR